VVVEPALAALRGTFGHLASDARADAMSGMWDHEEAAAFVETLKRELPANIRVRR
jgi:hypothetical protein